MPSSDKKSGRSRSLQDEEVQMRSIQYTRRRRFSQTHNKRRGSATRYLLSVTLSPLEYDAEITSQNDGNLSLESQQDLESESHTTQTNITDNISVMSHMKDQSIADSDKMQADIADVVIDLNGKAEEIVPSPTSNQNKPAAKSKVRARRIGKLLRSMTDMQLSVSSIDQNADDSKPAVFKLKNARRTKSIQNAPALTFDTGRKTKSFSGISEASEKELNDDAINNNHIQNNGITMSAECMEGAPAEPAECVEGPPAERRQSLDIRGQTGVSRYPWLRDVAVQVQSDEFMISQKIVSSRISNISGANESEVVHKSNTTQLSRQSSLHNDGQENTTHYMQKDNPAYELEPSYMTESDPLDEILNPDLQKYKRGGRRPCIISDLDLGPERHEDEKKNSSVSPPRSNSNRQSERASPRSLTRESSTQSISGLGGSKINLTPDSDLTNGHITPISSDVTTALHTEKSRSLTKSFIKLLPSRKKVFSPETLEYFLRHELKPSEFYDDKLLGYRHSHWRELIVSKDGDTCKITDVLSDTEMKRLDAVWELFVNEIVFLTEHLMVLKHVFMEPLKKCQVEDHLMLVEPHKLFGNLDELCHISYAFCQNFMSTLQTMIPGEFGRTDTLVECLDKMTLNARHGDLYHAYLLNYKSALSYLDSLRNEVEEVGVFEKFCEQDSRCNRLKLTDLLVAPMHHWTRLPLVLTRIRKYTTDQKDCEKLDESINNVVSSLKSLDNKMEWMKTFERVKDIERQLVWPSVTDMDSKAFIPESLKSELVGSTTNTEVLADQVREVLYEGQLVLTEREKTTDIYAFLFTDILLLTKIKKDAKKSRSNRSSNPDKQNDHVYNVMRQPISVHTLTVYDISSVEASSSGMKHAFCIAQKNDFQQVTSVLTLQAHTSLGKEKWMSCLNDAREQHLSSMISGAPPRQESFKYLLSLEDSLLKNSRVLEITNGSLPRPANHKRLRKLNSSVELLYHTPHDRLHVRQKSEAELSRFVTRGERTPSPNNSHRNRALSVGSLNQANRRNSSSKDSLTIEENENTATNSKTPDAWDDVVFQF